jgi:hypothetical protein
MFLQHTIFNFLFLAGALHAVSGHGRIKYPPPLGSPAESTAGNAYNSPLSPSGSDFPCKKLHLDQTTYADSYTTKWKAGSQVHFEILGQVNYGQEGPLAAHSGGSCQASISFDNGTTFKAIHSYVGGCPRGASAGSNIIAAGTDQNFSFMVPENTRAGPALFAWTWIAVSGNRNEFYMNCAKIEVEGKGQETLDEYPDMYIGEMEIPGYIWKGECASTQGFAIDYPIVGPKEQVTRTKVVGIEFKAPTAGNCSAPGSKGSKKDGQKEELGENPTGKPIVRAKKGVIDIIKTCGN